MRYLVRVRVRVRVRGRGRGRGRVRVRVRVRGRGRVRVSVRDSRTVEAARALRERAVLDAPARAEVEVDRDHAVTAAAVAPHSEEAPEHRLAVELG